MSGGASNLELPRNIERYLAALSFVKRTLISGASPVLPPADKYAIKEGKVGRAGECSTWALPSVM